MGEVGWWKTIKYQTGPGTTAPTHCARALRVPFEILDHDVTEERATLITAGESINCGTVCSHLHSCRSNRRDKLKARKHALAILSHACHAPHIQSYVIPSNDSRVPSVAPELGEIVKTVPAHKFSITAAPYV